MRISNTLLALSLFLNTASMGADDQQNATMAHLLPGAHPTEQRPWFAAKASAEKNRRLEAELARANAEIERLEKIISREDSPYVVDSKAQIRQELRKAQQAHGALMEKYIAERTAREAANEENVGLRAQVAALQAQLDALHDAQGGGRAFSAAAAPSSPLRPIQPVAADTSPTRITTVTVNGDVTIVDFGLPGRGVPEPKALNFGAPPPPSYAAAAAVAKQDEVAASKKPGARTAGEMTDGEDGDIENTPPEAKKQRTNDDVVSLAAAAAKKPAAPALTASQKRAATIRANKLKELRESAKGTTSISEIFKVEDSTTSSSSGQNH